MDEKLETTLNSIIETTKHKAEEVFIYYDGPRLVTVRTPENQAYIAVEVDETENSDIWLYAMVDNESLANITTGQEGFREVYSSGKYRVFSVELFWDNTKVIAKEINPVEIKNAWLPSVNSFLGKR